MKSSHTQCLCYKDTFSQNIEIWIRPPQLEESKRLVGTLIPTICQPGERVPPTLCLDSKEAQILMNQLWDCGVRPTSVGSTSHLTALENHLHDLQAILELVLPYALEGPIVINS